MAFTWIKSLFGNTDIAHPRKLRLAPSKTVLKGDMLAFSNGKLDFIAAGGTPDYQALEDKTSTANSVTEIWVKPVVKLVDIFEVPLTPVVNGTYCNSNSTATQVLVALADGSSSDLVGAIVYIVELNEWRIITANTYSSNVVTITVNEAFSIAPTTTHRAYVFNIGFGSNAVKADATTPQRGIGNARADASGGKLVVFDMEPKNKTAHVMFKP